jgi:branched-subunit amino acid aminotransferase/4-amino-4-deoxychorismate lyase
MPELPRFDLERFRAWAERNRRPFHASYFAMYSSVFGGIVTDPALMVVPVDDHMVHRGDGVFETFKCADGALYNLRAHLERLVHSARGIALAPPCGAAELEDIVVQTARAAGRRDSLVRVLLSRGPGSLGVNPYDCPAPALYVVVSEFKKPFMELHPGGASVVTSSVPVKPRPFSNIKSVNYLFNVLMKKEAVDAGADFTVAFDEHGHLTEGPTENAGIVTRDGVLRVPRPDRILAGTTMLRVIELCAAPEALAAVKRTEQADIRRDDVSGAAEMLIFGTTPDVTAVVRFDGRPVGDGRPGPAFRALSTLLRNDILRNTALRTPVL